jgi:hypothetical protein
MARWYFRPMSGNEKYQPAQVKRVKGSSVAVAFYKAQEHAYATTELLLCGYIRTI